MQTPCYCFDLDEFANRAKMVKEHLPAIALTYSIKANPFLLEQIPDTFAHVEVCSPGELEICECLKVAPERIIYSGVVKEQEDIHEAVLYGADIITCESIRHAQLVQAEGVPVKVLLRITSGNQFGMSVSDAAKILQNRDSDYRNLNVIGIHYFSGTQKTTRKIKKDLERLESILMQLKEECHYAPQMIEYGPGIYTEYFEEDCDACDLAALQEAAPLLNAFAERYPLAIEMGRYFAASCGTFYTAVKDIKTSYETNYLMIDGGMHHLNYYGQRMAMQIPPLCVRKADGSKIAIKPAGEESFEKMSYCVCGSLCTVADVTLREVTLPPMQLGDVLEFGRCGAYSMTEAPALFLSRPMPAIYVKTNENGEELLRAQIHAAKLNMRQL
ncbi:MAG: diaminopimelate decarboxylase [Eubacterium sp.]|nr:diaminopimelate decarboxylase [Eubacterium sp.]